MAISKRRKVIVATWVSPDEKQTWDKCRIKDKADWVTWIRDRVNQSLDTAKESILSVYTDDATHTEWSKARSEESLDTPVPSWSDWIKQKVRLELIAMDAVRSVPTSEVDAIREDITEIEHSNKDLVAKNRALMDEISFLKKHQLSVTDGIVLDMLADGRKRTFDYLLQDFVQYQGDALYATLESLAGRGLLKVDGDKWSVV